MIVKPTHAILLADLVIYMLTLKGLKPDIAAQTKKAIQEGRYYELN